MDKRKLVNIIIKDLEEIKALTEEVAESDNDSSLIIDLALNRARLLCQEIGLLRELAGNSTFTEEETYQVSYDKEEEDNADYNFPDPELEILNFEDREFSDTVEIPDEEEIEEIEEDDLDDLDEEDKDLMEEDDDLLEIEEDDQEEIKEEDLEEDDFTQKGIKEEDSLEVRTLVEKEVILKPEPKIQVTELRNDPRPGVREINIDDPDDMDDIQPIRFTPPTAPTVRPPMREIPKPDFLEPESPQKKTVEDKYYQVPTLNDTIGEKAPEPKITFGKISSLRAAIGLNDRFLFIREIFDNNTEKFNAVIEHLDKLEQISEAVEYLKANLSMQKNEASMKFVDLLKRRFTP